MPGCDPSDVIHQAVITDAAQASRKTRRRMSVKMRARRLCRSFRNSGCRRRPCAQGVRGAISEVKFVDLERSKCNLSAPFLTSRCSMRPDGEGASVAAWIDLNKRLAMTTDSPPGSFCQGLPWWRSLSRARWLSCSLQIPKAVTPRQPSRRLVVAMRLAAPHRVVSGRWESGGKRLRWPCGEIHRGLVCPGTGRPAGIFRTEFGSLQIH